MRKLTLVLLAAVTLALTACENPQGSRILRADDPVVLTGAQLPSLVGADPYGMVGFVWNGTGWEQVPVQVDERDLVSPGAIYHWPTSSWPVLAGTSTPYRIPVYTPPPSGTPGYSTLDTYTPADSDPAFDADDELVFLGSATGRQASGSVPAPGGVDPATRTEVQVTDPLVPDRVGFTYLFETTSASPAAVNTGVQMTFNLLSGTYKSTYKMGPKAQAPNNTWGANLEDTTVTTPHYAQHFGDRWLNDGITTSAGVDFVDRSKWYVNVSCYRTEDTFDGTDNGNGAIIVSTSGPVRAIRSYIGANSYIYTANTHVFYPSSEVVTIELRGHDRMPGFGSSTDLTTGLTGMIYLDAANPDGLVIDGQPDAFTPTTGTLGSVPIDNWQAIVGSAGTMVSTYSAETTALELPYASVYTDRVAAPAPCTGDSAYWGEHGLEFNDAKALNTDPTLTANPDILVTTRHRTFLGPIANGPEMRPAIAELAEELAVRAHSPLVAVVN